MSDREAPVTSGHDSKQGGLVTPVKDEPGNKTLLGVIQRRAYKRGEIIPFPEISRILSWYRIRRTERETFLYDWKEAGLIEVVPFHGIIIKGMQA
jgi:hypothetical protein